MDVSKYQLYTRDINLSLDDLSLVIQDVVNEIARTTNIFKEVFVFTLEKDTYEYDIQSIFNLIERTRRKLVSVTINDYTDDQLKTFLSSPEDLNVDTTKTYDDNQYYNQLIDVNDFLTLVPDESIDSNKLVSIFNEFTQIGRFVYKVNFDINKYVKGTCSQDDIKCKNDQRPENISVLCMVTIIPNINNITDEIEAIIKPVIIEGIKYYVTPGNSNNFEQTRYNNWGRYHKAMLTLLSEYPNMVGEVRVKNKWDYLYNRKVFK